MGLVCCSVQASAPVTRRKWPMRRCGACVTTHFTSSLRPWDGWLTWVYCMEIRILSLSLSAGNLSPVFFSHINIIYLISIFMHKQHFVVHGIVSGIEAVNKWHFNVCSCCKNGFRIRRSQVTLNTKHNTVYEKRLRVELLYMEFCVKKLSQFILSYHQMSWGKTGSHPKTASPCLFYSQSLCS